MSAARPPSVLSATHAVLYKELTLERRAPQTLTAMALFCASAFVIFHFALGRNEVEGALAAGVLWVTLALAALLGIGRSFVADREEGGLDGFLLAPAPRTALLVAKATTLLIFLLIIGFFASVIFSVLLLGPTPNASQWASLALLIVLANLGIALVGTLIAGIAIQTRARDLITSILALPLLIPLLIAVTKASEPLLTVGGGTLAWRWLALLGLYDLIFGLLAYALFDYLVED